MWQVPAQLYLLQPELSCYMTGEGQEEAWGAYTAIVEAAACPARHAWWQ